MLLNGLKKLRNGFALLSLGLFVNCEAKSLEFMAEKYSFFEGIEVLKTKDIKTGEKVVWIDVRPEEERSVAVIKGSLTQEEFLKRFEKNEFEGAKLVAYCTVGHRSGKFAQKMKSKGVVIANLYGGILSWVATGKAIVDSSGNETQRVHVYGSDWNILPDGYEGVW